MEKRNLYVIKCGEFPYYKIGIADYPHRRIADLQIANPHPLSIIITVKMIGVTLLEAMLHEKFKGKQIHEEWFHFTQEDILDLEDILYSSGAAENWLYDQIALCKAKLIEEKKTRKTQKGKP